MEFKKGDIVLSIAEPAHNGVNSYAAYARGNVLILTSEPYAYQQYIKFTSISGEFKYQENPNACCTPDQIVKLDCKLLEILYGL